MEVRLTKVSDLTHRLEVTRRDGTRDTAELASRSFLLHDFIHYAIETEAGLDQSFWGLLAGGKTLADVHESMPSASGPASPVMRSEAAVTESVVRALTAVIQDRADSAAAIAALGLLFEAQERQLPPWLTIEFVDRVHDTVRRLRGQWRATPYGSVMRLQFGTAASTTARSLDS